MKSLLILCSLGAASLCAPDGAPATATGQEPTEAATKKDETGAIAGKIIWDGKRPKAKPDFIIKEKESKGCIHSGGGVDPKDRSLLIDAEGGVANVVLKIKVAGVKPVIPEDPIVVDQKGCRFEPHVQIVPVGATLRFDNSDGTNHNIHTYARKNQPKNKNVAGGDNFEQKLDKAEVIKITCDIHTWMTAYIVVTDASFYAKSGADGSFKFEGLPPGKYKISTWHEQLGKGKTKEVMVAAGEVANLDHKVKKKKKRG